MRVVRGAGDIDVHVVPGLPARNPVQRRPLDLGRASTFGGFALAAILPVLLQLLLAAFDHSVATAVLIQLAGAVAVALVGGLRPAVVGALVEQCPGQLLLDAPAGRPGHRGPAGFPVPGGVPGPVRCGGRRSGPVCPPLKEAAQARAEAGILGDLALDASRSADPLRGLLSDAVTVFGVAGAAIVARQSPGAGAGKAPAVLLAGVGDTTGWHGMVPPAAPPPGSTVEPVDAVTWLVLFGREVAPDRRTLLGAVAVHIKAQLERRQLETSRLEIMRLAEGNTMRTAILRAVSHDLRTPLAGIKLAAGGLLQDAGTFTRAEERELVQTIDECSDRLDLLVGNLLDMSRITAQSVEPLLGPVRWHDVLDKALRGIPSTAVAVVLPPNMPAVDADPGLLERVIANIVENALKYAPGTQVAITGTTDGMGSALAGHPSGELRIADRGPGVPAMKVVEMFRPFQRLDDAQPATGVGLGLAVAQGFVEAMRGSLTAEETPGGGLTMVIRLPLSTGPREQAQ